MLKKPAGKKKVDEAAQETAANAESNEGGAAPAEGKSKKATQGASEATAKPAPVKTAEETHEAAAPVRRTLLEGIAALNANRPDYKMVLFMAAFAGLISVVTGFFGLNPLTYISVVVGASAGAWIPSALHLREPAFWKLGGMLTGSMILILVLAEVSMA